MKKLKAVLFLMKCAIRMSYRILQGRTWHLIQADIEEKEGTRVILQYRRTVHQTIFQRWEKNT